MAARRKALAHIHLAITGLPRLESAKDAYRLYLAEALLDDGLPPREMLAELGLGRAIRQLDKFDPDQPRVPAGSGRESGQWTKDGASTSADDEDHKRSWPATLYMLGFWLVSSYSADQTEYRGRFANIARHLDISKRAFSA